MKNTIEFKLLESENLILRRIHLVDAFNLYDMRKDPSMNTYTDNIIDYSIEDTISYINKMNQGIDNNKWIIWAIELKQNHHVIGTISIWNINFEKSIAELGYGISPIYQGQGLMKEALLQVIDYGFNIMNLKILEAYTEINNLKSVNLLKTCKFKETSKIEEKGFYKDQIFQMLIFQLENPNQ